MNYFPMGTRLGFVVYFLNARLAHYIVTIVVSPAVGQFAITQLAAVPNSSAFNAPECSHGFYAGIYYHFGSSLKTTTPSKKNAHDAPLRILLLDSVWSIPQSVQGNAKRSSPTWTSVTRSISPGQFPLVHLTVPFIFFFLSYKIDNEQRKNPPPGGFLM
jgi:hypothetical protein